MLVGLIGDTHDRVPAIAELVRQMQAAGVGMVLHAGDYCAPFSLKPFEDAHVSLAGVFGRNDGDPQGLRSRAQAAFGTELFESPHSFEVGGQRILLIHDIGDVQGRSITGEKVFYAVPVPIFRGHILSGGRSLLRIETVRAMRAFKVSRIVPIFDHSPALRAQDSCLWLLVRIGVLREYVAS